jgi:hypothetical protein
VARKGANRPIFEGETPPKKMSPNIGADIGAITGILLTGPEKGVHFGGSIFPSKIEPFAQFLATIQALSRTRVFLLSENEQKLLCWAAASLLISPCLFI